MRIGLRAVSGILGAFALAAGAAPVVAAPLIANDYNVLVFGDFTAASSDVEGRLAAGGNVSLNNYSVGDKLTGGLVGGATLVAGGTINFPSGRVYHGDIVAGGSTAGVGAPVVFGMPPYGVYGNAVLPVDFAGEQARLAALSAGLGGLAANGSDLYQWSQLFLTGDGTSATQVFDVSAADLAAATNIVMSDVAVGTDVIVNVHGAAAQMSGGMDAFFAANRGHVLFNFVDAATLDLGNIGVEGSILAPLADITTAWGVIWGQVAAASWNGPMQVNQVYYDGWLPADEPPPPQIVAADEPAGLALLAAGLVLGGSLRSARRRNG